YVVGQTYSPDWPAVSAFQSDLQGLSDIFLARIQFSSSSVDVTIDTVPPNLSVVIDGTTNTAPATFSWPLYSFHQFSAFPVSTSTNVQYAWTSWSDNGARSHAIYVTNAMALTSYFKLQYFLDMTSTNITSNSTNPATVGGLSPPSGWYDAGTNLEISIIPPFGDVFTGWLGSGAGSFSGTNNPSAITMDGPITDTATLTGPLTNRMTVVVNGNGTVSPDYNGQSLTLGKIYSITAKPASGSVFS